MLKIALTGGIGCGKSTVCNLFSKYNIPIIDSDIISHELVKPNQPALLEIVDYFGSDILQADGQLDRKQLAKKVFNLKKNKQQLETILHPKIKQLIDLKVNQLKSSYVIIDIPLLIETKQHDNYDRILVIDCTEEQQITRTKKRDNRSKSEINSIMSFQVTREERLNIADDIIDNTLDIKSLESSVERLHIMYLGLSST